MLNLQFVNMEAKKMNANLILKSKIISNGETQKSLAKKLKMNQSTLSLKINGISSFTESEITTISKVLRTTPEQIFFNQEF